MKLARALLVLIYSLLPLSALGQVTADNSNLWPVHKDTQAQFCISYPPDWIVVPPKGRNVRFSINPPDGPGNCNVVVRQNPQINSMSQEKLNQLIEQLPQDRASWADYAALPSSQVRVVESRIAKIGTTPALLGILDLDLENLEGKYARYQIVVLTLRPGQTWTVTCGASSFSRAEAKSRFEALRNRFNKILGSLTFLE